MNWPVTQKHTKLCKTTHGAHCHIIKVCFKLKYFIIYNRQQWLQYDRMIYHKWHETVAPCEALTFPWRNIVKKILPGSGAFLRSVVWLLCMATSEVRISLANVFSILTKYLKGQNCLKWIPHLLHDVQCAMLVMLSVYIVMLSVNTGKLMNQLWMFIYSKLKW